MKNTFVGKEYIMLYLKQKLKMGLIQDKHSERMAKLVWNINASWQRKELIRNYMTVHDRLQEEDLGKLGLKYKK